MKIFEITILDVTIAPTYYALMYILGFIVAWFFVKRFFTFRDKTHLDELFFYVGLGIIIGGRLGYVLLYNFSYYTSHPLQIFAVWEGGMSFHGGLLGVILATCIFAKKFSYKFWSIIDILAVITPIWLAFGRFGNYLNNELYGFADYHGPFAMMVEGIPHFPSPLLELFLEGIWLFLIMIFFFFRTNYKNFSGKLSGVFLTGYAAFRIFAEFFRLPDVHIGYILGTNFLTIGMLYTIFMLFFGLYLIFRKNQ